MATIFFTGFPGFLGSELLPKVVLRSPDDSAVCLVQDKFMKLAEQRAADLVKRFPALEERIELIEGDITNPDLGLGDRQKLAADVREIYHLAAVYDLSVKRAVGMKINVEGTTHMLDFAASCSGLERFQYVSTCYVSGTWPGIFSERDLDKGPGVQQLLRGNKIPGRGRSPESDATGLAGYDLSPVDCRG